MSLMTLYVVAKLTDSTHVRHVTLLVLVTCQVVMYFLPMTAVHLAYQDASVANVVPFIVTIVLLAVGTIVVLVIMCVVTFKAVSKAIAHTEEENSVTSYVAILKGQRCNTLTVLLGFLVMTGENCIYSAYLIACQSDEWGGGKICVDHHPTMAGVLEMLVLCTWSTFFILYWVGESRLHAKIKEQRLRGQEVAVCLDKEECDDDLDSVSMVSSTNTYVSTFNIAN